MFMGAYLIEDETVCDNLVSLFGADPVRVGAGVVGRGGRAIADHASKVAQYSFQPDDQRLGGGGTDGAAGVR